METPSFGAVTLKEQALAYWLTQAAIAIDPINYDQNSVWRLRQKRLLEEIMLRPQGIEAGALKKIANFTKLFWANRGNHNEMTAQKFLPEFTFEELKAAAAKAQQNGAFRTAGYGAKAATPVELNTELSALRPSLFDPAFEPTITAKSPEGG